MVLGRLLDDPERPGEAARPNLLNVALTRAKRAIYVADAELFQGTGRGRWGEGGYAFRARRTSHKGSVRPMSSQ